MRKFNLLFNAEPNQGGGGYVESKGAEQTATPPAAQTEAQGVDDYGYAITPPPKAAQVESADPNAQSQQAVSEKSAEEGKASAAGYGEEDPKPVETPAATSEAKPDEDKTKLDFEVDLKDFEPKVASQLKEFAKTHKLSKEQTEAIAAVKKSEIAATKQAEADHKKAVDAKVAELKASWHKELKSDPNFGGDKFAHNLKRVDKLMTEFLGETKKQLTDSGSMLPPYVMRDLAKLASHLYKTETLVQGDSGATQEKHFLDVMYP